MSSQGLPALSLPEAGIPALEIYRRIEKYFGALGAIPKKSWRPKVDAQGILVENFGLERMKRLLELTGHPSEGRSIVHVVGTSGKGSTSMMIACAFHAAGCKTAAFFSPHLTTLAERFWVRGRFLEAETAGRCAVRLADAVDEMAQDPKVGLPSYFEMTLALFLLAAEESNCEFIVLEAGLGGTYDATNAVGPGVLDVITSVSLDHTDLLGDTVTKIARDKAGIITPGGRVISAAAHPDAQVEIKRATRERGASLYASPEVVAFEIAPEGSVFDVLFDDGVPWEGMRTSMHGFHQARNAALAAAACRLLCVEESAIRSGIEWARQPGRVEPMPGKPIVILDGAHNRDKAQALIDALAAWPAERRIFVFGSMGDKDYPGLCEVFASSGDQFYATLPPAGTPRPGLPPEYLAAALRGAGARNVQVVVDSGRAFEEAMTEAGEDSLVVVAGSLYLAGKVRQRWISEEGIIESGQAFPEGGRD